MNDNKFFKPTALYKEYMILDMIEKNPNITQREMSQAIGIAVSMVNDYLDQYEKDKLIKRKKHSTKNVEYLVTKKGIERKKVLNIGYLTATKDIYFQSKENIEKFLAQLKQNGYNNILLYGAGEVAEMILHTVMTSKKNEINIHAVIDDDITKVGQMIGNYKIISRNNITDYSHDGILISTYTRKSDIKNKLISIGYPMNNIIEFFE